MADLLNVPPEDRVGLKVRDLTVTTKPTTNKKKNQYDEEKDAAKSPCILNNVSFDVEAGSMMAIMGGSGSGKTTLLNTLSGRMNVKNKNLQFDGFINYSAGGGGGGSQLTHVSSAYLLQTDHFLPGLTVLETLKFQAELRIWSSSSEERLELINLLLEKLELTHLASTLVVDFTHKIHLSGGERRRLSLAIQLLSRPKVLFLDEPTTGLDLSSSLKLIGLLQKFCQSQGITVILSIHQPRLEITNMFDNICLLTRGGRVIYYGNIAQSQVYFNDLIPQGSLSNLTYSNFIDYIIDLSVKDTSTEQTEQATVDRINRLVENWTSTRSFDDEHMGSTNQLKTLESVILGDKAALPFYAEIYVLTKRSFITTYRDYMSVLSLVLGGAFLAILCGWIFFRPTPDLAGIRSLTSVLYVMLEVIGFSPLFIELERLCYIDGPNYVRERTDNIVSPLGFLISRRLGKLFLEDLPTSILFGIITFYMWGLNSGTRQFFIYLVFTVVNYLTGVSVAMVAYALATSFPLSIVIVNITYQIMNLGSGYFINASTMPVYVRWVKYIAYFYYSMEGLASNQFTNWYGACTADDPQCAELSGSSVLRNLGFKENYVNIPIVIIVAFTIGLQLIAWVQLYFKSPEMSMVKEKRNKIGGNADDELLLGSKESVEEADPSIVEQELKNTELERKEDLNSLELNLAEVSLVIKAGRGESKVLLENILAHFKGSGLNAIMGPSGSGKTTLLNYLTNRLSTKMKVEDLTGSLYLNDYLVKDTKSLMKISSIVPQQDYLLPTLTVRETLFYQAKLRLPLEEHKNIPNLISSLIRKTGLTDCADLMIGNEDVKGISGGEKRRLTIAIQLLNRSKILFLDEPTSGLDSATATSILQLLKDLAQHNDYTVVCTIHQPNQDMLSMFQNILLLGRGGKALFNGAPSKISSYFESIGYPIVGADSILQAAQLKKDNQSDAGVSNNNIADAMLDLVGKQINETLEDSQKRVIELAKIWCQEQTNFSLNTTAKDLLIEESPTTKLFPSSQFERKRNPMFSQITTLTRRQFVNSIRSFDVVFARYVLVIFLAIIYVLFFTPLRLTQDGINNRLGLVQEVLLLYYVGLVNNLSLYPFERDLFYTEYRDGIYGAGEFMAAYAINEFPAEFLPSIVFSVLCVFSIGLPRSNEMFWSFFICSFVVILCGESLGIMVNSVFNHLGLATNLLSSLVIVAIFMGGTMSLQLPPFFKAWNYISPLKYASEILMKKIFHESTTFSCSVGKVTDDFSSCTLTSGPIVLKNYGFVHQLPAFFGGLIACLVLYRVVAVLSVFIRTKYFFR